MTPQQIIADLKTKGITNAEIAKAANCTIHYISKIRSGERKHPNYQIVDNLRAFHKKVFE